MCDNPNLDLGKYQCIMQNLVKIHSFILKILSGKEILISLKGHNSAINLQKTMWNDPNLDLVNINA